MECVIIRDRNDNEMLCVVINKHADLWEGYVLETVLNTNFNRLPEVSLVTLELQQWKDEDVQRPFMVVGKEYFVAGRDINYAKVQDGFLMYHAGMEGVAAIARSNICEGGPDFPLVIDMKMLPLHSLYLTRMEAIHAIHLAFKCHVDKVRTLLCHIYCC